MTELKHPCILIECPHCHNDVWIKIGMNGGWDVFFEGYQEKICYECLGEIENFEKFNKK